MNFMSLILKILKLPHICFPEITLKDYIFVLFSGKPHKLICVIPGECIINVRMDAVYCCITN